MDRCNTEGCNELLEGKGISIAGKCFECSFKAANRWLKPRTRPDPVWAKTKVKTKMFVRGGL